MSLGIKKHLQAWLAWLGGLSSVPGFQLSPSTSHFVVEVLLHFKENLEERSKCHNGPKFK